MRFRFIHAADIHLGYEQYNLDQRANDFARAYLAMVAHAIEVQADFVLIAGDLFHKANTDAWTLRQAMHGLQELRDARIPVVAVEGNHDAQHYHKNLSWMQFLADHDLMVLLNAEPAANGVFTMRPFDTDARRGSWVDLAGARIYGLKYYGAATARILEQIEPDVEAGPDGYTILMLHAGMEGQVPNMHGGLTPGQLAPFRAAVDYVALGHVHKRLMEEGWLFNPGSTEINSFEEIDWPHGFFDVQVDTDTDDKHEVTPIETPSLRPFRRISVSADDAASAEAFVERVEERIAAVPDIPEGAVIELALGGVAEFRRQDVNVERLKSAVQARFAPLTVRIRNALVPPGIIHTTNRERLSRSELERQIVEQLVNQHAEYRETAPEWGRLILDVKNMAVEGDLPANIVDHVREALDRKLTVSPNGAPDGAPEHVLGASPHPLTPSPASGEGE
jgi:DNA repair exonuclease SbcCD nuclease subunit